MIDQMKYNHFIEMYRKAYPDLQWLRQEQWKKIKNSTKKQSLN